eukprot:3158713-Rhodomonas_salina.1
MSSTDLVYGTAIAHGTSRLRPCYAMSGTDLAYVFPPSLEGLPTVGSLICLRTRYAMSVNRPSSLRTPYAMSGTDLAYAATSSTWAESR